MSDYISREAAIALLKKWADGYSYIETPTEDAINEFNAIPAADVRPVVLCRDCIHRPYETVPGVRYGLTVKSPDSVYKCPCYCDGDGWYSYIPDDDFFCANGERLREGGTP